MIEPIQIALADVGLDLRPERQVRPIDQFHVQELHESDPAAWEPILVRPWPENDPFPDGETPSYQVISGYHRTTAARGMDRDVILAIVRADIDTDAKFLALAIRDNNHGKPMTLDEKRAQVKNLREEHGLTEQQIADAIGASRSTIHNWLSNRDTNASRKNVRTHAGSVVNDVRTHIPTHKALSLTGEQLRLLDRRLGFFLGDIPIDVSKEQLAALAQSQSPYSRGSVARCIATAMEWLSLAHEAFLKDAESIDFDDEPDDEDAA